MIGSIPVHRRAQSWPYRFRVGRKLYQDFETQLRQDPIEHTEPDNCLSDNTVTDSSDKKGTGRPPIQSGAARRGKQQGNSGGSQPYCSLHLCELSNLPPSLTSAWPFLLQFVLAATPDTFPEALSPESCMSAHCRIWVLCMVDTKHRREPTHFRVK